MRTEKNKNKKQKPLVATRFWGKSPKDMDNIHNFVNYYHDCGYPVIVIQNVDADNSGMNAESFGEKALVVPVTPWGFASSLNAGVIHASANGFARILFASTEVFAEEETIETLWGEMTTDTIVCGAALPGHDFQPGKRVALRGTTVPWNTCALWDTRRLSLSGFPPSSDHRIASGVEEVDACLVALKIFDNTNVRVVLVGVPGISWETNFSDAERAEKHRKKMGSKNERPAMRMREYEHLGTMPGGHLFVEHIDKR